MNIDYNIYIEKFKDNIFELFGGHVQWSLNNEPKKYYILGFFYKEDFKIPFHYYFKENLIEIKVYFNVNFTFDPIKEPIKNNIVNTTEGLLKFQDFEEYVNKFTNFFNKSVNLELKNFLNNFYFINNLKDLNEDKRAIITFTISDEFEFNYSFVYTTIHNYKEKYNNNKSNIEISIDNENIYLKNSKDSNISTIKYYDKPPDIHDLFNRHFKLKENILTNSDFDSETTMCSIIEKINEFKIIEKIIKY